MKNRDAMFALRVLGRIQEFTIVRLRETAKKIFIKTNRMADWNQKEPTIFEQQYQVDEQIGNYLQ